MKFTFNPFTSNLDAYETFGSSVKTQSNTGSDLTGIDGDTNRTLAFTNSAKMIFSDGMFLHPTVDWTQTGGIITFNVVIFNSQQITIYY